MSSSSLSNSNNSASSGQLSPEQVYLTPSTAAASGEEGNQKSPSKHHIRLREFLPPPPPPPPFLQRFKQSSSSSTSATSPNGSEQAPLAPQMQTQTSLSPTSPPVSTTTSTAAKSPKEGHKGFSLKQIKSDIKSMFKHSPGSACGTNNNGAANWPLGPHPKAHRLSGDASPHIITEEIQTNRNSSLNNELGHSGSSDVSLSTRVGGGGGASSVYPNAPHTIGTATGARLIQDMINDQQMQQQQRQMLNGEFDPLLSSSPGGSQLKRSSFIEADPLRRNTTTTNNNNQYNPLMGSTPSLVLSAAQCQHIMTALSSNNSSIPNSYNNINTATANNSSAVMGNFNPRAAAINLKIISSNQPAYYHIDRETLADVQKKLALLSPQERVALQKLSYQLLLDQYELKRSQIVSLEEDIKELNRILCARNQTIRSQFEIDNLRNEIRNLTNEKAELEIKISQKTGWTCSRCTYINKNEDVVCVMCNIERDVTEIYICKNCNTKNSITNMKCTKCSAHLGAENQIEAQQLAAASGGNPATNNNHQLNSQMSTTSTGSSGGSPHPYHHQQQQYYQNQQSSPTTNNHGLGGNRSRNASATSLNGVGGSNQALVDALAAASLANSGAGSNGSGKISHRPPPPIPPPYSPSVGQRSTSAHPVASAPNLGLPSIPYVPGIGVVHHSSSTTSAGSNSPLSPPIASPNNNSPILSGNRTPLVYNTSNSTASPTFNNNNNNNGRPRYL